MNHIWYTFHIPSVRNYPDMILEHYNVAALPLFNVIYIRGQTGRCMFKIYSQVLYSSEINIFIRLIDIIILGILSDIFVYQFPDESEIAPYGTGEPYEMTYESRKIPLPTESEELESFPVRRYHIDTNEHVNNCQYVQMALESLPKDKEVHQMRVEYKKSAVYGDMIYPRIAAEDDRTVVELCDENAKPYAVIEFRFA